MIAEVVVLKPIFADKIIRVMVNSMYFSSYVVVFLLFALVTFAILR
jgi:hypothetical protein